MLRRLLLLLCLLGCGAHAHPLMQNAMWVVFSPDLVRVAVNVSLKEIFVAQQVKEEQAGDFDAAAQQHSDYVVRHLVLRASERELTGRVVKVTPPAILGGSAEQTFFQYELEYPLPGGGRPEKVSFRQRMLREWSYAPGEPWEVSYLVRAKRSDAAEITTGLLLSGAPADFPTGWSGAAAPQADTWKTFREYLHHGVIHILTGYDHLLFVTALVLAALSFWEMVKVIAAFTLAHTLTLVLSVLNIFRLPPWFVEPVISVSIVFVAVENIFFPRRAHSRARLAVAFGFGLVHGLGFAGGLLSAMEGLPRLGLGVALLAFSLGVEIGHQVVVLPVFGLLRLGDVKLHAVFRERMLRYGSIVISLAGVYYLINAITSA